MPTIGGLKKVGCQVKDGGYMRYAVILPLNKHGMIYTRSTLTYNLPKVEKKLKELAA